MSLLTQIPSIQDLKFVHKWTKIAEVETLSFMARAERERARQFDRAQKQRIRAERHRYKYEIKDKSIAKMVQTAKALQREYPGGFTAKQLVKKYIELNGKINPYTLEVVDDKYDISAAIRGFMYETSPSSEQHWFRYGMQKVRDQVAPWLFYNKSLALVNNCFDWKVSTPEMSYYRRRNKGKWFIIDEGSNAYYSWDARKYGPLPSDEQLKNASNRKIGVRRGKKRVLIIEE